MADEAMLNRTRRHWYMWSVQYRELGDRAPAANAYSMQGARSPSSRYCTNGDWFDLENIQVIAAYHLTGVTFFYLG